MKENLPFSDSFLCATHTLTLCAVCFFLFSNVTWSVIFCGPGTDCIHSQLTLPYYLYTPSLIIYTPLLLLPFFFFALLFLLVSGVTYLLLGLWLVGS